MLSCTGKIIFTSHLRCGAWHFPADPAAGEAAAEVAGCIELLLQALERQKYTPAYDKWLGLVRHGRLAAIACLAVLTALAAGQDRVWAFSGTAPLPPGAATHLHSSYPQVQGHKLISALVRSMQGAYPPGVQQAAKQLKASSTGR